MAANMETPAKLASLVVADFKQGAESILDACSKIASAYDAIEEDGAWKETQFVDFIDRLAEAGIGPGSSVFYKNKSEKFQSTSKAATYYYLMSVGRCEAFKTPEFRRFNRTTSYSTLYRLVVLFNHYNNKITGNPIQKNEKAHKAVLDLVEKHGADLSRKIIDEALNKAQTKRRSYAPQEDAKNRNDQYAQSGANSQASLDKLIENEEKYDLVLMTPSEEQLEKFKDYSDLTEIAPYQELRRSKSKVALVGTGRQLESLKALAETAGGLSYVYCIRETADKKSVINISEATVVFTSSPIDEEANRQRNENLNEYVRRLVGDNLKHNARKLQLFCDEAIEGWDSCPEDSSLLDL